MNKLIFALMIFFIMSLISVKSQNISFSFTANHTCDYVALDSVLIENITQGGDTVLYWSDTVLTFIFTNINSINAIETGFYVYQNFPNPFDIKTDIYIYVPEKDEFSIHVYDLLGREVAKSKNILNFGMHSFTFYAGNSKNYILTVQSEKEIRHIQMIQFGHAVNAVSQIIYNGITNKQYSTINTASNRYSFPYVIGDELRFTGYVSGDFLAFIDTPLENQDYFFDIANASPAQASVILGNQYICNSQTDLTYSVEQVEGLLYEWEVPEYWMITSGQGTNSIIANAGVSGNISVIAKNNCGNSPERTLYVNVYLHPNPVFTSSNSNMCIGDTRALTATPSGGTFSVISGTASINVNELTVNGSGTIQLQYSVTENGCTGAVTQEITVNVIPEPTFTSSNSNMCIGDTRTLTATPSGGTFSVISGTASINANELTVNGAGTIQLQYSVTENGCAGTITQDIAVYAIPDTPSEATNIEGESQIIWNWNPSIGAEGYKYNSINDYSTAIDNGTSTTYTQEGLDCGVLHNLYVWAYNNCGISNSLTINSNTICPFICQTSSVSFIYNGIEVTYGTVESNGKCWLDRNLGASQVAINKDDNWAKGSFYQWGRQDFYNGVLTSGECDAVDTDHPNNSNFIVCGTTPYDWRLNQNNNLWQGENGINNPCPIGWRVPNIDEWETERESWTSNDPDGAFNSPLKLVFTGYLTNTGIAIGAGAGMNGIGMYWSSTINETASWALNFSENISGTEKNAQKLSVVRAYGLTVRCIKECPITTMPTEASHTATETQIIWNWNNSEAADGYKYNTVNNYYSAIDNGTNTSFTQTDLICGNYSLFVWAYNECGPSEVLIMSTNTSITFIYNGSEVTYGTVESNGKCWLDRNLGASQVATSSTDNLAYGDLFQWGRAADGHQIRNSTVTSGTCDAVNTDSPTHSNFIKCTTGDLDWRNPQKDELWQGVDGINNPCPEGWRLPTIEDWDHELTGWTTNNAAGAFASPLKLTTGGMRSSANGTLPDVGTYGYYWSSITDGTTSKGLNFYASDAFTIGGSRRANGRSVRCIKDCPIPEIPTETTHNTTETQIQWNWNSSANADGYQYNTVNDYSTAIDNGTSTTFTQLGLGCGTYNLYVWAYNNCGKSNVLLLTATTTECPFECGTTTVAFIYNGSEVTYGTVESNGKCWLDRNLGASQVATNSTDNLAYGDLFQWGRAADGHQLRNSSATSGTCDAVSVNSPPHSNFIKCNTSPYDWRSPQDNELWQGVNGINNPCPAGWRLPTSEEWNTERQSWSPNYNSDDAFASPLKLPLAGRRHSSGTIEYYDTNSYYWSSSISGTSSSYLYIATTGSYPDIWNRANGLTVRCIKE